MPKSIKTKRTNKIFRVLKSKKFKDKLGPALFLTRISSVVYRGRLEKKLSQQQLSKMARTTQRIVSEIENGNYNMGSDLLYRLFKVLDKELICDGKNLISGEAYSVVVTSNNYASFYQKNPNKNITLNIMTASMAVMQTI